LTPTTNEESPIFGQYRTEEQWDVFDEDKEVILASTQGRVERKIKMLPTLVYSMGLERFGC